MRCVVDPAGSDRFQLTTEDYLHSLITTISELARLSPNAVTVRSSLVNVSLNSTHARGQNSMFTYPLRISRFCKELNAGFALLNLKNDSLRKRFDGIKCELACIIALREAKSHPQTTSSESRKSFTTSLCEAWCQPMSSRATSGRGRRMELRRCNNAIRIFGFQVTYSPRSGLPFWLYGTYPSAGVLLQ